MKQTQFVAVIVVLAFVAGACSGSKKGAPRATAVNSAAGTPATEAGLRAQIRTQGLTPERAADLFALDIGPLPGVAVDGIKADDDNFDGTDAVSYLFAEWTHLTPAQQQAANKLLAPARTLRNATTRAFARASRPQATLLAARQSDVVEADLLSDAQSADTDEGTELGVPAIGKFVIDISDDMGKAYGETHYYEPPYQLGGKQFGDWKPYDDGCHITVWQKKWTGLDPDDAAAIMAHEVFHCYAQRAAGMGKDGTPNYLGIHDWVGEGEATWVMAELHPNATVVTNKWSKYAFTPETKYVDRSYDAIGVFGHEGDVAGSQDAVWPLLLPVNNAAVGGEDSAAFAKLLNSTSERFYSAWGASYYEDAGHTDWHMAGPAPPSAAASPTSMTIDAGDAQDIGLLGTYQSTDTTIQSNADILVVILASGYGKAHDQNYKLDATLDTTAPLALCLKENGCKCPDGSPGASEHTTRATSPISVGMNGGDQQLAAYAAGASLDSFCKKPDPQPPDNGGPPPTTPGGGGGDGGLPDPPKHGASFGDPHLNTFDGSGYDLQTVGEMTLVKSTTDDFTIQVRTAPRAGSNAISINTAIATRAGGHKLMIGEENGAVQARLDGALVVDEVSHVGNVSLQRIGTSGGGAYVVTWPDGTVVHVSAFGAFGVNVDVAPAPARKGKLTGLLGDDDGRADTYVTGDGHALGLPPSRDALNTTYTDSWRVTPATSLFTYAPGQSTATFTDKTFPRTNLDATNAPDRATIEQQCRADGVTDPFLLDACIIDGAELHSPVVFSHYAHAQVVQSVRDAIAHGRLPFSPAPASGAAGTVPTVTTVPGAGSALRTIVDVGRVNAPQEAVPFPFAAHAGDVIWIGQPDCDDGGVDFGLVDPSGKTVDQDQVDLGIPGCEVGRFALTADGEYQLVANIDKQRGGGYSVPIRFQRADVIAHTQYGQTLSGTIAQPAAHDVYEFDAQTGDVVHINGPGCNVGPAGRITGVGFENVDGAPVGGLLDCTPGSQNVIQQSGKYRLVVNFPNEGPFPYSFTLQK